MTTGASQCTSLCVNLFLSLSLRTIWTEECFLSPLLHLLLLLLTRSWEMGNGGSGTLGLLQLQNNNEKQLRNAMTEYLRSASQPEHKPTIR